MADDTRRWIDAETRVADAPADHHDQLRLWLRLFSTSRLIENHVRSSLLSEFETTFPRFDILSQLYRVPDGLVLGELSKRLMVSPGNVTSIIEHLVESGDVSRTLLPTDRRVHVIRITRQGAERFAIMAEAHEGWIRNLMTGLSRQEITQLMQLLQKLKLSVRQSLE
jgi:DNA-binding MarR family transcriptional regulator